MRRIPSNKTVLFSILVVALLLLPISTQVSNARTETLTASKVITDINKFSSTLTQTKSVTLEHSTAVKNYVARHGLDHVSYSCLADFGVTSAAQPNCILGNQKSTRNVVLFGDSHAWQWGGAFDAIGKTRNWKVNVFTKSACPPELVSSFRWANGGKSAYPECATWRSSALAAIAKLKPMWIFFSGFPSGTSPALSDGMTLLLPQLIRDVNNISSHVVWIRTTPVEALSRGSSLPTCLARFAYRVNFSSDGLGQCYVTFGNAIGASKQLDVMTNLELPVAMSSAITVIDPMPWLCQTTSNSGICPPVILDHGVYYDVYHIANSYALFLFPLIAARIP
jgi:hypothetical protein